jgi:cytochrome c oxidase subunit II
MDNQAKYIQIISSQGVAVENRVRRVVIASANALFREGLRRTYEQRWAGKAAIVDMPASFAALMESLQRHQPDLVILDYDDRSMNREEFLCRFVDGQIPMQVVLVSLGVVEPVVVYDRRTLTAAEAQDWLNDPWT